MLEEYKSGKSDNDIFEDPKYKSIITAELLQLQFLEKL